MNTDEILNQLKRPFPVDRVHWRIGSTNEEKTSGLAMAYIDARDVTKRLDEVVPMQWQDRYSHAGNGVFVCEIGIKIEDEWLWRANGAGETQFEAEKGGLSDAFKRAATMWGIGLYLYKIPSAWVNISKQGSSYRLNQTPPLPDWATPEGYDRIILKRKPYNERQVSDFIKLIDTGDAYGVFAFCANVSEAALDAISDDFPHGKKTEYKRKVADLRFQGREIMLESVTELGELIDKDDSMGVLNILDDETARMVEIMRDCLLPEQQDKLSIILEEQKAA